MNRIKTWSIQIIQSIVVIEYLNSYWISSFMKWFKILLSVVYTRLIRFLILNRKWWKKTFNKKKKIFLFNTNINIDVVIGYPVFNSSTTSEAAIFVIMIFDLFSCSLLANQLWTSIQLYTNTYISLTHSWIPDNLQISRIKIICSF